MTVASLMQRLKTGDAVAPVALGSTAGATGKTNTISLFSLKEMPSVAPVAPVAPQKTIANNKAAPAPTTGEGQPLPKFHSAQPWKALDRAFQAHYWNCPACKVAGRTRGPLCPQGQPLKDAVDQAFAAA